jgi:hypothetical protein
MSGPTDLRLGQYAPGVKRVVGVVKGLYVWRQTYKGAFAEGVLWAFGGSSFVLKFFFFSPLILVRPQKYVWRQTYNPLSYPLKGLDKGSVQLKATVCRAAHGDRTRGVYVGCPTLRTPLPHD